MQNILADLDEYSAELLRHADRLGPPWAKAANAEGLERIVAWSAEHSAELEARGPDGVDPLVGVQKRGTPILVWRAFPRIADGVKVALLPGVTQRLAPGDRAEIVRVLEGLDPSRRIGPGQQLEIGVHRIAAAAHWSQFKIALDCAVNAVTRLVPAAGRRRATSSQGKK